MYEDLIWQTFGQYDNYPLIKHELIRIREVMEDGLIEYKKMTAKTQFEFSVKICLIVTDSTRKSLRQLSLSKDTSEVFKYSVEEGFTPPVSIEIGGQKLLKEA